MTTEVGRWNHNIHYQALIASALPAGCDRLLDVGSGDGTLTRALTSSVGLCVGLDRDRESIERSARETIHDDVHYVLGDVLHAPFPPSTFDAVVSIAALHHIDAERGLAAMVDLLRPGGTLAVVGLARSSWPQDVLWEVAAVIATRVFRLRRTYWEHSAPTVWPPPLTYRELNVLSRRQLPGSIFKRRVLWRYSIVWTKPR